MTAYRVSDDLQWWRAHRDATAGELGPLLTRLRAWEAQHDQERAGQLGFLRMAWDAIFADEAGHVADAIAEIEATLGSAKDRF